MRLGTPLMIVAALAAAPAFGDDTSSGFTTRFARYEAAPFAELPDWDADDQTAALAAFRQSCDVVGRRANFRRACEAVRTYKAEGAAGARAFFEENFRPYRVQPRVQAAPGLLTGYFEPLLLGSRVMTPRFKVPIYARPDDMNFLNVPESIAVKEPGKDAGKEDVAVYAVADAAEFRVVTSAEPPAGLAGQDYYEVEVPRAWLANRGAKIRVRLEGHRVVPYPTRAEIERDPIDAKVLAWVDSAAAAYVLHVQGSGRIRLPNGRIMRVGYAEQNGHPFLPKRVAANHPSALSQVRDLIAALQANGSMPKGPRAFRMTPPESVEAMYAQTIAISEDPSYVFFREIPNQSGGPLGALGIPLTPERSVAVDPRSVPLGLPMYISATRGLTGAKMQRLVIAQDVGGAIKGAIRADFFWGFGPQAGLAAMKMSDALTKWVLLPQGFVPSRPIVVRGPRGTVQLVERECLLNDDAFCSS